jgi:hypothetical protein
MIKVPGSGPGLEDPVAGQRLTLKEREDIACLRGRHAG